MIAGGELLCELTLNCFNTKQSEDCYAMLRRRVEGQSESANAPVEMPRYGKAPINSQ